MAEQGWDVSKPIDHTKISVLPEEIRGLRSSIKTVIQKEHVALGAANSGGQHLKGAARVYLSNSLPTTDPESSNLDTSATSDDGRIAIATGGGVSTGVTNTMKVYIATSAGISTGWKDVRAGYAGTAVRVSLDNDTFVKALTAGAPSTAIDLFKINSTGVLEISSAQASIVMTSTVPTVAGEVANKAYVDADRETALSSGGLTGAISGSTASFSKVITHPGGMIEIIGYEKEAGVQTIDISAASFTGIYTCQLTAYDTQAGADRAAYCKALTLTQITWEIGATDTELEGVFYHVIGY